MATDPVERERSLRPATVATLTALLTACGGGGLEIDHDYDPQQSFERYVTYAWSTPSGDLGGGGVVDEFMDLRVRAAIDSELLRAGLTKTEPDQAQLTVGYVARVAQQVERPLGGINPAQVDRYGGTYDSSPSDRWFSEGTLEIGLVDVTLARVVWRGTARAEMDPTSSSEQREERIERAVREVLRGYPPGGRGS